MPDTGNATSRPALEPGDVVWLEPRILFGFSPTRHDDGTIRDYYATMRSRIEATEGAYVFISDTRQIRSLPNARARHLHGELGDRLATTANTRCVHAITIVDGVVMRAIVATVLWFLRDTSTPHEIVATLDDALVIARAKLR